MKDFWKHGLIFLFAIVLIGSILGSSTETERKNQNMSNAIVEVEEHISNGLVIEDGVMKEETVVNNDGNFFANTGNTLGNFIINIISSILETGASIITKLMG